MKMVESYSGFQPLEEAWIGGTYPEKFYEHLPNEIEDTFCHITEQTTKSFSQLEKTLGMLGVKVRKPVFSSDPAHYMDQHDNLIKPPVSPRDWVIALGPRLLINPQGYKIEPYADIIEEYQRNGDLVEILDRSKDARSWLQFPAIVRVGSRLIVDTTPGVDQNTLEKINEASTMLKKEYEVIDTHEGAHLDGVFCPIKEGYIFSSHWGSLDLYKKTFPDWQVFWKKYKSNGYNGKWWVADNDFHSPIFNRYIEQYAYDWVGNVEETVFEVNMLVVDEKNVICMGHDEESFEQIHKIGMTPHVVDFPARGFWDGGIHCITVDIRRKGGCVNYFNV